MGKYVVLIRILPSRLMHSTDRRRRIYIRVADNSRGYDLASVSDLEWLWERKTLLEEKRKEIEMLKRLYERGNRRIRPPMLKDFQEEFKDVIPAAVHLGLVNEKVDENDIVYEISPTPYGKFLYETYERLWRK